MPGVFGNKNTKFVSTDSAAYYPFWNTSYFYPNGILTYRELQTIYSMMLFLAVHGYMNKDKFKDENFKYGDNRVWWGYSLEDINAIANFDFTTHPFIPRTTNKIL